MSNGSKEEVRVTVTQYVMSGLTPVASKVKGASQEMVASTTGTDCSVELTLGEPTAARIPVNGHTVFN